MENARHANTSKYGMNNPNPVNVGKTQWNFMDPAPHAQLTQTGSMGFVSASLDL